jgi:hypothetical protein
MKLYAPGETIRMNGGADGMGLTLAAGGAGPTPPAIPSIDFPLGFYFVTPDVNNGVNYPLGFHVS